MTRTNISKLIKELFSKLSLPQRIKLVFEFDTECSDIMIDLVHLKQIFTNLASNAVSAMPETGTIIIETRKVLSSELEGDFVEISFADTGSGIKKKTLENIFEPFFTTKSEGMGLGLSIVKDIVTSNDGEITVESEEGKGSTFKMIFPEVKG